MALALQSSALPLKSQQSLAPQRKHQARCACFPSITASLNKQNSPYFHFHRRFQILTSKAIQLALSSAFAFGISLSGAPLVEAKVGVNKPELLPKEFTTVIDVAGFLSSGQEQRLSQAIEDLEKDTGYKLRILAQNYPDTPGLAIKDFWQVDERTIVFVADPTFGNIINFNVGSLVDLDVPRSFWNRLAGKYGNMFYWKEKVIYMGKMHPLRLLLGLYHVVCENQ